jgi:hypothetical protein
MTMNLIDAYVSEVGRRLPQKSRADIEAEIRSAIQDLLEERARQSGKPADDEATLLEVLKEYGDPEKVARSYRGEQYLIGPRLYPIFEKVIFIVLPITVILALIGLAFSLTTLHVDSRNVADLIGAVIGNILGAVISTVGSIAVIFAIIERVVPEFEMKSEKKAWDPRSLFKISPPDRVKPVELIVEIFFAGLAIILFNFYPQLINIGYYSDGSWWVGFILTTTGQAWETTLLSEAFFSYLPILNATWGLTIVLNAVLIRRGRWEIWSRWGLIGVKALMIGVAIAMFVGPSLISVTAESLLAAGFPANYETAHSLIMLLNQGVRVVLGLTILFGGLDVVKVIIHLFRQKKPVVLQAD